MDEYLSLSERSISRQGIFCDGYISKNELEVRHRSTDMMWSDVLNKPKQGTHLRFFRGALMNVSEKFYDNEERNNMHPVLFIQ